MATVIVGASALALGMLPSKPAVAEPPFTVRGGIVYSRPDGQALVMDAYLPVGAGLHPGIIVLHGGGWAFGSEKTFATEAKFLAKHGFAAFSIEYRLAPKYPYPLGLDDCKAAVEYVRQHAAAFSVDPSKMGALGGSAGGNLAGMLATMGSGSLDTGARIRAAVSWSGPQDMKVAAASNPKPRRIILRYLACTQMSTCDRQLHDSSPISYVDGTDAAMFLANSSSEVIPLSQAQSMANDLKSAGVPVELVQVPGARHSVKYRNSQGQGTGSETVMQASADFLRKWLDSPNLGTHVAAPSPKPSQSPIGASPAPGRGFPAVPVVLSAAGAAVLGLGIYALSMFRRNGRVP